MSILALLPLIWTTPGCAAPEGVDPDDGEPSAWPGVDTAGDTAVVGDTGDTGPPAGPGPALAFSGDAPTNLLFITLDTLRRDRIGRWDTADRPSATPFLDGLLAEAPSWTPTAPSTSTRPSGSSRASTTCRWAPWT